MAEGTGKPDVDDIKLDDVRPARKGPNCLLVVILLIAIAAVIAYMFWARGESTRRAQERAQVAQTREASLTIVKERVGEAV